jgi:hypothetical protein
MPYEDVNEYTMPDRPTTPDEYPEPEEDDYDDDEQGY